MGSLSVLVSPRREDVAEPCVEQCMGCAQNMWPTDPMLQKIEHTTCRWYLYPASKWRAGDCPGATHLKQEPVTIAEKKRVGQQKGKGKK